MCKKLHFQYKADTGNLPLTRIEDLPELNSFPVEYWDGTDLILPTPDYLTWLETQLETRNP